MISLNCETYQTTLESLETILRTPKSSILKILLDSEIEAEFEKVYLNYENFDRFLSQYIESTLGKKDYTIDEIFWFHFARTLDPEQFRKGIYPLGIIKDQLFNDLYKLIQNEITYETWKAFIENGISGRNKTIFKMRLEDSRLHGCNAFLIQEVGMLEFNHPYLKTPEIVEDICIGLEEDYGIDLTSIYYENSVSTIVQFKTPLIHEAEYYIGVALNYIYHKINNMELTLNCNTCFDAYGKTVPSSSIIKISQIQD